MFANISFGTFCACYCVIVLLVYSPFCLYYILTTRLVSLTHSQKHVMHQTIGALVPDNLNVRPSFVVINVEIWAFAKS